MIISGQQTHSVTFTSHFVDIWVVFIGQETTANQLSFTLYEVLKHPDVEKR